MGTNQKISSSAREERKAYLKGSFRMDTMPSVEDALRFGFDVLLSNSIGMMTLVIVKNLHHVTVGHGVMQP